jgi:hypothetical protein
MTGFSFRRIRSAFASGIPFLAIVAIVAVLLLLVTLVTRMEDDLAESRFAAVAVPEVVTGTLPLQIVYPVRLRRERPEHPGRPLTARLSQIAPTTATQPYTITLSGGDALIFTDAQGRPVPPQLVLASHGVSEMVATLFLRPVPLIDGLPRAVTLVVNTPDRPPFVLAPIAIEPVLETRLRFLVTRLGQDLGLPLVLATTAVGLFINEYRQWRATRDAERRQAIQDVRAKLDQDPADGLLDLQRIEKQLQQEEWAPALQDQLEKVRLEWQERLTHAAEEQLLRDAGGTLEQGDQERGIAILKAIDHYFEGEVAQPVRTIGDALAASTSATPQQLGQAVAAAFELWDVYDEDARDLVVQTFQWVERQKGGPDQLSLAFNPDQLSYGNRLRLLRDPRLRSLPALGEVAQRLAVYRYDWPPVWSEGASLRSPALRAWLDAIGLNDNPFGADILQDDTLLPRTWAPPRAWDIIRGSRATLIVSAVPDDLAAVGLILRHELQTTVPQQALVIDLTLPAGALHHGSIGRSSLYAIAGALAERWIWLMARSPSALLDLPRREQQVLAGYLALTVGSGDALLLRLHRGGLKDDAERRMLERALTRSVEHVAQPEPAPVAMPGQPTRAEPAIGTLLAWLGIRPPGLQHTYVVLDCAASAPDEARQQVAALTRLAPDLAANGVVLKLLVPQEMVLPRQLPAVELHWRTDDLVKTLRDRMRLASGRDMLFGDLFAPPRPSTDTLLAAQARGSLSRLLWLGNRIVAAHLEHLEHDPGRLEREPDLDEGDLAALNGSK